VLDVTYEAGLSSPGRLHDLFVTCEAITPGQFKQKGAGLEIAYGFHPSPFGECLLCVTDRGVCGLAFTSNGDRTGTLADLQGRWPQAQFYEDSEQTWPLIERIFVLPDSLESPSHREEETPPLKLHLRGTNFQLQVWQALLKIPPGAVVSYETIATSIGRPGAARAIGQANCRNPISFIIPCHRVIRKIGALGGYHWGLSRKKAIIAWEAAWLNN